MSGRTRRILNLGLYDRFRHLYSLRRLDLLKTNFFHPTAEQVAAHGKVLPTLTPAEAKTTRISSTNLAAAEAAAPKIDPPKTELVIRPPQLDYSLWKHHTVHFLATASESKVVLADRGNRMLRFDVVDGTRCIDTLPTLHGPKVMPMAISVPPTDVHLRDREDTGELYIIDGLLYPHMAEERPQFEALVWRGIRRHSQRFWHCDILPLPPWITHRKRAFVHGHALVGDTICFSISGEEGATTYRFSNSAPDVEGAGTYCFHMATREWSKAGDWLMPFHGKADYVPELGLWFGISSQGNLPCAADLTGVVAGEEPPPEKVRIWARDDLPEEWQPDILFRSKVASLGSGRFILMDNLGTIASRKGFNSIVSDKEFTLFTGMEVAFSNGSKGHNSATDGSGNESGHHNSATDGSGNESGHHNSSSGDENGGKGKAGTMCGLRMIKHKSGRHMYNRQLKIEAVF